MSLFEITNTKGLPMGKQATRRIPVYLTPEQFISAKEAMATAGYNSASDWLRDLIRGECERLGIEWPGDIQWGGVRTPKSEGEAEN